MADYTYIPVDSLGGEIRLLKIPSDPDILLGLHRPPVSKMVPIRGSLYHAYLPSFHPEGATRLLNQLQLPLYRALSYVWGSAERTHEIWIDGRRIPITANLFQAVRALQEEARSDTYIWADAICINQKDMIERSEQVRLMRIIYHDAAVVQIWLGNPLADTLRIVRFIKLLYKDNAELLRDEIRFSEVNRPSRPARGWLAQSIRNAIIPPVYTPVLALRRVLEPVQSTVRLGWERYAGVNIYGDDNSNLALESDVHLSLQNDIIKKYMAWRPTEASLLALKDEGDFQEIATILNNLLSREWFERIWCVQEIGASRNATKVRIGPLRVDWKQLVQCVYYLHHVRGISISHARRLIGLEKIHLGYSLGKRQPLQALMREFKYKRATDARDKVFALLGLMGDEMSSHLQADYTKSVAEVYINVTLHFTTSTESLDPICDQQYIGKNRDLPAWTPDYTLNGTDAPSSLASVDGYYSPFKACGHGSKFVPPPDLYKAAQTGLLPAFGRLIDVIDVLSMPHAEEDTIKVMEERWRSLVNNTVSIAQVSTIVGNYSDYNDAVADSQHFPIGCILPETLFDSNVQAYIYTLFCGIFSPLERLSNEVIQGIFATTVAEEHNQSRSHNLNSKEYINKVCHGLQAGLRCRRLAITQHRRMAAVVEHAEPGDLICILHGCSVPVVLRNSPNGESWEFVGACYIHGYMDGEAASDGIDDMPFLLF